MSEIVAVIVLPPVAPKHELRYRSAMTIKIPEIAPTAYLHPTCVVVGDVVLGEHTSIWPTAVLRGDTDRITVGARSNVQDGAVLHADPGFPTTIGHDCVIGHRAIVHGATLEDGVLVGMGAIVLNGAHIERGSMIGAGAVVKEGMRVPAGSLVVGIPARVVRALTDDEQARILDNAARYVERAQLHASGMFEAAP
jgi:carbonic anhydrase/acetyltransferase-like protein (isoleucine patch superfamily)